MFQEIYIIDNKDELLEELKQIFKEKEQVRLKRISVKELEQLSKNLPFNHNK